jgi:hypothetical protein
MGYAEWAHLLENVRVHRVVCRSALGTLGFRIGHSNGIGLASVEGDDCTFASWLHVKERIPAMQE